MRRSAINECYQEAKAYFEQNGWILPPQPRWDITDFGLGNFDRWGLTLINLAEEPEYCEKLMYARPGQATPAHYHAQKKEDIICRRGLLAVRIWAPGGVPQEEGTVRLKVSGHYETYDSGHTLHLRSGERVTLEPGIWHEFWPLSLPCIIGEVSTANDDLNDNYFFRTDIGRYPEVEEDQMALVTLLSERS